MLKKHFKTPAWIISLSVIFFVLLYFIVIFILFGDLDVLNKDWIVPKDGILWKGLITENNYQSLYNTYHTLPNWNQSLEQFHQLVGHYYKIITPIVFFNPWIIYFCLIGLTISLIYPFILKLLKFGNYDILPFSLSCALFCMCFIFTNWIPYFGEQNELWRILLRVVISFIITIISFFIINYFINLIIFKSKNAHLYVNDLISLNKQKRSNDQQLRSLVDNYKSEKNNQEYIDIEKK